MRFPLLRSLKRAGVVTAAAAAMLLAGAVPALAHVTAQPGTAAQGGYTVINFRVPTESDSAGTIKVEVAFPQDHPVTSARTTPIPGWTAVVQKGVLANPIQRNGQTITQAVTSVTWTAEPGTRIGPGQFVDFPLSVGPLPSDTDRLVFPATQTYDDGKVVAWNQLTGADGQEPNNPAPTVTLTPAAAGSAHGQTTGTADEAAATDTTARWIGGAGLVVGVLGLAFAWAASRRAGRRAGSAPAGPTTPEPEQERVGTS
ncbi:MAG: nuclear export factor GLE1 [Pseudonocardia sp. SCN 72-86]|nr:MAG: nuclear export factor GLE1 [Pseudonocardia sp. SCN 72-86]